MSLGRFLQDKRIRLQLTVEEVAVKANVSVGTVRAVEQGRRTPSVKSMTGLLSALDITESTWVDSVTWQDPLTFLNYNLAPKAGGWPNDKKTADYTVSESKHMTDLARTRIEAIELILATDRETLMAVITLLKK